MRSEEDFYVQDVKVLLCKGVDDNGGEPQTITLDARQLALWVTGYKRHDWRPEWQCHRRRLWEQGAISREEYERAMGEGG